MAAGKHSYFVKDKKIGYIFYDKISFNILYGYLTTYAYFAENEKGNIEYSEVEKKAGLILNCGYYSYAELATKFDLIYGVTSTLDSLH